ncbi:MAG: branched-chain amino acid ABC transporter permease [Anaerolineae bacterium]|nr:branched-chain amino acid ABC transporter permease [Anaerolineae bacterium]
MNVKQLWRERNTQLIVTAILIALSVIGWTTMGQRPFIRTLLSGLTLGALLFMVASGLTLIFGLMDVLNFAHGTMFMVGAYAGWQFYTNPTFLFGLAPLVFALITGLALTPVLRKLSLTWSIPDQWRRVLGALLILGSLAVGLIGVLGLDIKELAETAMVASMVAADPSKEATPQEPLTTFWYRPTLVLLAGLLLALAQARPGDRTQVVHREEVKRGIVLAGGLFVLTIVATLVREAGPLAVLKLHANLRFLLCLLVGTLVGAGLGAVVEMGLIRPLYERPLFQVLVTLGLAFVLTELIQVLWDPLPYQMSRPPLFSQPGKADSILAWFSEHTTTVDVMGVTFPSYRLFIIVLGVVMLVGLHLLMNYSRLGMIIRAGVQDREMVEALGINVERVFTLVFALGAGLAALGGIGAAPFIPVEPVMGDRFLMQGFITVVIGGMGSYSGAAVGALLLGLARAFGDYLALKFSLTPAISEASTVIVMAIVLLVRPAGFFGRRE